MFICSFHAKNSQEILLFFIDILMDILYNPSNDGILPAKYFETLL